MTQYISLTIYKLPQPHPAQFFNSYYAIKLLKTDCFMFCLSVNSLSHQSLTQSSSVLLPNHPFLAIDRSYNTCFRSQKESKPWWQVTLEKPLYVETVQIFNKIDCCPRDNGMINVTVSTSQTGLDSTCTESMAYGRKAQDNKVHCSPPARGSYVTVTLIGDNVTLVICQVVMRTIESSGDAHGVLREGWYNVNYKSKKAPTVGEHPAFKRSAKSRIILRDFDAPVDIAERYIQRLTSYLQVPESGNYTFYVSCDNVCELWKYDVNENGIDEDSNKAEESVTKQPIIIVKKWTKYLQWNRYPEQMSQPIFLDKCRIYRMVVFMGEGEGGDHLSVGMRKPSGEYERPIPGKRLFWTNPVDSAFNLSCVNISFTATFNTDRQPENFTVKVSYSFVNNSEKIANERVLGDIHLQATVLKECDFESGYCGWTSLGEKDKWKFSKYTNIIKYQGFFAYIDGSYKAQLESPLLPWEPFHQSVGLCLRFNYIMPVQTKSTLERKEKPIIFEGEGFLGNEMNVAIDDVIATTENCSLRPYFAEPVTISLNVTMVNASRRICCVMATLRVNMVQTRRIANVLPTCLPARGEMPPINLCVRRHKRLF
ncbi:Peptidase inhibitor 16 [Desmophyllum pertusum]|uniref:Peptidase inhibitor 16 n=1 Tax=Desmophyllum pertusum TaxID=174260 RepID=A0A9W9ZFY5_9CNID|nr:Peptidase inhibitor 16 [Desmophyllum pertusum]